MAHIVVGQTFWYASGDATWLQPGQSHEWTWPLRNLGEAISISVRPLAAIFGMARVIVESIIVSDWSGGTSSGI
jgi:hypothetical protein